MRGGPGPSGADAPARGGQATSGDGDAIARLSPGDGPAGRGSNGAIPPEYESYVRALRQRIQDRLVYPWTAVRRGQEGVVELEVRLGVDGRLVAVEVVAGVSADALRGAAVSAVRGSAPFPFPPGLPARPLVVRLPVEFRLR
jgi:periplasmic protein TonB